MSLAETFAGIAAGFAAAVGGPFEDVTVRWPGIPTRDAGGSITSPATPVAKTCKAQFDIVTEAMRTDPAFLEKDVRILVLAATLDGMLDTSVKVVVATGPNAGTWSIETCNRDSVGIGWECRARKVS